MQRKTIALHLLALVAWFPASLALAEFIPEASAQRSSLTEAAQAAVLKSPDVLARWHAFREAREEVDVARGGYLPKIDVSTGVGHRNTEQKKAGVDYSYDGNETSLTLRQMLFDGFATSSEVGRLGKARLVRYFELLDASENVALEAARAYLDVVRYRQQVSLAEDNYLQHQAAYEQLKRRADSGVGKRVDVDQAASRLALADVNLTTAYANLHDVSARFLRIVGEMPPKEMALPARSTQGFPQTVETALNAALAHNPSLRASVENIESSQFALEGSRAAFMPRVDLVARRDDYSDYEDNGSRDENRIELRLNFNLFNGGSDAARFRQYRERKNVALDQREKACRDVRQTLAIAYNDTRRIEDQLAHLALQVGLVEKTRTAYRDQFNIGQRTLLDLLNTQNEYFDARRSQVNAEVDLSLSYLRSYAGMGKLLETLGLKHVEIEGAPGAGDFAAVDSTELCPPFAPLETTFDREKLASKAKSLTADAPVFVGARPAVATPSGKAATAPASQSPKSSGSLESELSDRLTAWAEAWSSGDVARYLSFYSAEFVPENGLSRESWERQRRQRIAPEKAIRVEIEKPVITVIGPNEVRVEFRQNYSSGALADLSDKTLEFRKTGGRWSIVRERAVTVAAPKR